MVCIPVLLKPESAFHTPDEAADSRMFPVERPNPNTCHESVSNAVSKYLKKRLADVAITRTPSLQTKQANTNRIADLVVTPEGCAGKYIDFTVSNPAAPTYCNKASHSSATEPNSTNLFREKEKCRLYASTCAINIVERNLFVPFAIESTGKIGNRAQQYLLDLFPPDARGFSKATPIMKQIGIIICKYNAQAILHMTKRLRSWSTVVEAE